MSLSIKKGDTVLVIAGKDKGKSGKVLVSQPADNSVVVAGVNMISKHKKPRSAQDKGGIIKKEGKIDASNVQVICPTCGKATRINNVIVDGKKIRQCKKCLANLAVKKVTAKSTKTTDTKKVEPKTTKATTTKTAAAKKPATKTADKEVKVTADKKTTAKSTTAKTSTATKTTKSTSTKKVESK